MLEIIKQTNDWLEGVPLGITEFFKSAFKSGEDVTQKEVDIICTWAAWKVNIMIERRRQAVIKALSQQYAVANAILKPIRALINVFKNPLSILSAVVSVVKQIIHILIFPFEVLIKFLAELVKEVARFAANLAAIAEVLPPDPPNPNINFDAFKLDIKGMSISTLTDDPDSLPSPEEMYPEPIRPWTAEAFDAAFAAGGLSPRFTARKKSYKLGGFGRVTTTDLDTEIV